MFDGGPADSAGIRVGDLVDRVEDAKVGSLEDMYRTMWSVGGAGADVKFGVIRGSHGLDIFVRSGDRRDFYTQPRRH